MDDSCTLVNIGSLATHLATRIRQQLYQEIKVKGQLQFKRYSGNKQTNTTDRIYRTGYAIGQQGANGGIGHVPLSSRRKDVRVQ